MQRNRLLFSTIAASFVLAGTAAAQKATQAHFGVLGGAVFSKLAGSDVQGTVKTRTGLAAGVFANIGISKNFSIEPEALYVMKGAKQTEGGTNLFVKLDYIEVPVLAKISFPAKSGGTVSPHIYAGPALGFKASCKLSATEGSTTLSGNCADTDFEVKVKGSDLSLVFGGGVDVGRAIIDVRYDLGLSRIVDQTTQDNVKNRALYLLVGWTFGPGH